MGFVLLLILSTLSIAGSAAFFSIYGLAQIFTGSFWPVVVMASSLEAGKLISASYVYRYWNKISILMRSYLITAIIVLMIITSAGIFGFFSAAYQQDILPLEQNNQQVSLLLHEKEEITALKKERVDRRKQIDADIANLPNNYIKGRQRLMKAYGPELEQIRNDIKQYTNRIREITEEVGKLKQTTLHQQTHIGPIVFIAKAFHETTDTAVKWVILLIIFAFDPLAVILTIGANIALLELKNKKTDAKATAMKTDEITTPAGEISTELPVVINQGLSAEDIEQLLEERFSAEKNLTPDQQLQKTILEETLAKKKVTERIRNPKTTSDS